MVKYYKISYYNGDNLMGGQFLEEWQLKQVKHIVDVYFLLFNIINVRMELIYQGSTEVNVELQKIEVF